QGQVTSITDALQHTSQFAYTGGDLTSVTDPLASVQRRFLDGAGRLIAVTDPLGRQTRFVPDKLNRVTTVTDPMGGQTAFAYDPNGRVLSLTDALAGDRVTQIIDSVAGTITRGYDLLDRLTSETTPEGSWRLPSPERQEDVHAEIDHRGARDVGACAHGRPRLRAERDCRGRQGRHRRRAARRDRGSRQSG